MAHNDWERALRLGFKRPELKSFTVGGKTIDQELKIINDAIEEHIHHSPAVREVLNKVVSSPLCPKVAPKVAAEYLAKIQGDFPKNDPGVQLHFMKNLMRPVFEWTREESYYTLLMSLNTKPEETAILILGFTLAKYIDTLFLEWYEKVVLPYATLNKEEKQEFENCAQNVSGPLDYMVFDYSKEKGITNCRPWSVAFSNTINDIVEILNGLAISSPNDNYKNYFTALALAYGEKNWEELENRWAEVDRCWIKIGTNERLVFVHGMEDGYLHPFGITPELRIEIRRSGTEQLINNLREKTVFVGEQLGLTTKEASYIKEKLSCLDVGTFYPALLAGSSLDSKLLGQVVPNRQEILEIGGKIFINDNASIKTVSKIKKMALPHTTALGQDVLRQLLSPETETALVIGHELFHPVGFTPEVQVALPVEITGPIEEAKATLGGILTFFATTEPEFQNSICEKVFANCFACIIRFCYKNRLEDPGYAFYVNENLAILTTMRRAGLVNLGENGLRADWKNIVNGRWQEEITIFVKRVLSAYREQNADEVANILNEYCSREEPFTASVIKFVNR